MRAAFVEYMPQRSGGEIIRALTCGLRRAYTKPPYLVVNCAGVTNFRAGLKLARNAVLGRRAFARRLCHLLFFIGR
jgi:hypothetical protein